MARAFLSIVVDCRDSLAEAEFWAPVLGHQISERNEGECEVSSASARSIPLYFMSVPDPKMVKNRPHSDITTDGNSMTKHLDS